MQTMRAYAQVAANEITKASPRSWMLPMDHNAWTGDPADFESIGDAFPREQLNETVQNLLLQADKNATTAALMAARLQLEYMAMMERSFRARHLSPVRATAHSLARLRGHGDAGGVHEGGVLRYIQNIAKGAVKA